LRAEGLAPARGPGDGLTSSSSSLVVAVWHVLDSLPGPSVPGVLEWRLTTDLTGRWAGLVIAVAGVVAFAALPLIRTVVLWARLTFSPPEAATPATALARKVTDRLDAVISQLETNLPHDEQGAASPTGAYRICADSRGRSSADADRRAAVMNARAALDELWRALREFRLDAEPEPATTA
jgi:hypothetical protein